MKRALLIIIGVAAVCATIFVVVSYYDYFNAAPGLLSEYDVFGIPWDDLSFHWGLAALAVSVPLIAAFLLGRGIVGVRAMEPPARQRLLKTVGIVVAVIFGLVLVNGLWRYENIPIGKGQIIQRDRLTNQMRTCDGDGSVRCSIWRD